MNPFVAGFIVGFGISFFLAALLFIHGEASDPRDRW